MSFLTSKKVILTELEWLEDDLGEYWRAKFMDMKTCMIGITGTYYELCIDGLRPSRARQENELRAYGV